MGSRYSAQDDGLRQFQGFGIGRRTNKIPAPVLPTPGQPKERSPPMNNEEKILALLEEIRATQEKHGEMLERHDETLSSLQQTVTRVALTQENIVLKSLDALAEGQDLTHQRLKDLAGKDELAELREEVRLLRTVVAQHTRDIEALKAAQ